MDLVKVATQVFISVLIDDSWRPSEGCKIAHLNFDFLLSRL